jgi:NADH dehydrogenase [ubiquinone] 1 alpha subcomplex assembly factor 1
MWLKSVALALVSLLLSAYVWAGSHEPLNKLSMFDFGNTGCENCNWFVVVDGVMGGRSSAELVTRHNSMVLSGDISLENRGGFASIRTPYRDYDLSQFTHVVIRYRSTGQSFAFTLSNYRRFYLPRFKHILPNTNGVWSEVELTFENFKKTRFSDELGDGPTPSELERIIRLGLISNDKVAGLFSLEVDYIKFC